MNSLILTVTESIQIYNNDQKKIFNCNAPISDQYNQEIKSNYFFKST